MLSYAGRCCRPDRIIVSTILLGLVVYVLFFFVTKPWHLYSVMVLLAIAAAGLWPSVMSIYSEHLNKEYEKFSWGMYNFSINFALALSALAGAYFAHHISLDAVFVVMLISTAIALVFSLFVYRIVNQKKSVQS